MHHPFPNDKSKFKYYHNENKAYELSILRYASQLIYEKLDTNKINAMTHTIKSIIATLEWIGLKLSLKTFFKRKYSKKPKGKTINIKLTIIVVSGVNNTKPVRGSPNNPTKEAPPTNREKKPINRQTNNTNAKIKKTGESIIKKKINTALSIAPRILTKLSRNLAPPDLGAL